MKRAIVDRRIVSSCDGDLHKFGFFSNKGLLTRKLVVSLSSDNL